MEQNFSIDEILTAVNEIQNKRKEMKIKNFESKPMKKDYLAVPRNTLKIIEEAEKIKK